MNHLRPGQRVEVLWHRGEADVWYPGTALAGGRVQFDESWPFVDDGPFILEPEELRQHSAGALGGDSSSHIALGMDIAPPRVHNQPVYSMKHVLAGLFALLVWWVAVDQALAAGNQLIAPRAKGAADEAATKRILANTDVVQVYPVAIDPGVFGSNTVKVTIDGRERTFVGAMVRTTPEGVWAGKEGVISKGGARIDLIKQFNGNVFAHITTTDFFYEITNVWGPELLLKSDYGRRRGSVQIVDDPRDKDPKCDVTRVIEDDEVSKLVRKTVTRLADGSSTVSCDYEFRCRQWMYATNGETCPATAPPNRASLSYVLRPPGRFSALLARRQSFRSFLLADHWMGGVVRGHGHDADGLRRVG